MLIRLLVGDSTVGGSGDITLSTGTSTGDGGDITFQAGSSTANTGGDVSITAGGTTGSATLSSEDAYIKLQGNDIDIVSGAAGDISFVVPQTSTAGGTIGWGFSSSGVPYDGSATYDVRLTNDGTSSMFVSNVPVQVTTLYYSSDRRIKKDFRPVDTEDLLHRLQKVQMTEYGWRWRRSDRRRCVFV